MIFTHIPHGASVFVDANTLVYHFQPHPIIGPLCTAFVRRIELGEIAGMTSTHVLSEVAHRLMSMEAMTRFGWPYAGIAQRLRQHPTEVRLLSVFRHAIETIPRLGIQVLTVPGAMIAAAAAVSVPAVSVRSSTKSTSFPRISPMTAMDSTSVALFRRLATMAKPEPSTCE